MAGRFPLSSLIKKKQTINMSNDKKLTKLLLLNCCQNTFMDFNGRMGLEKALHENTLISALNVVLQASEKLGGVPCKMVPNETSIEKQLTPQLELTRCRMPNTINTIKYH